MSIRVVKVNGLRSPEQRATVCYVGRAFAGWPASPWGNPFKFEYRNYDLQSAMVAARENCLTRFRDFAKAQPGEWLADLWECCDHGAKPLGCWCIDATHGDGQAVVCHGQILSSLLHERFEPKEAAK